MYYYHCDYYDSDKRKYRTIETYAKTFRGALSNFKIDIGVAVPMRRIEWSGNTQVFRHGTRGFTMTITAVYQVFRHGTRGFITTIPVA